MFMQTWRRLRAVGNPGNKAALGLRKQALETLMQRAEEGERNDYEIYWLQARLGDTESRLAADTPL
jgi:hypothetical protein